MKKNVKKPLFITIEGIEGVGKSTAIEFIQQELRDADVPHVVTREPGGTKVAEQIRQVLLAPDEEPIYPDTELLLMFASRAQHIAQVIKPALELGQWVICDRFTDASYAYQGGGRQISAERIAILEGWVQGELQPDVTFLLDAPVEVGLKRLSARGNNKDRIEQEEIAFFERVRSAYLQRAEENPVRFNIVNASHTLDEVHEILEHHISKLIQSYV